MTMSDNMGHDPDRTGALRGVLMIVVVGAALGIAYNASGLASRPRHGLAWIKQPEKIESLEALQGAPQPGSGAAEASTPAPGPGDAVAATMETSTASASASGSGSAPAKHDTTSASKNAKSKSKTAPAKSTDKPAQAAQPAKGASAPATTPAASTPAASPPAPAASAAGSTGAAANLPTIPDVTGPLKVELATFKKLYDAGAALVIDAREAEEYTEGHIAGATSLPYNDAMAEPDKVKKLDPAGKPIVIYCSGGDCELSMDLAKLLVENGKRKVLVYEGGFPEWSGAGYAVTKGTNP
jgi:rhodanese-related sulfurtransferase